MGPNVVLDDRPREEGFSLTCVRAQKGLIHLALSKLARPPEEGPDESGRPPPYARRDSTTKGSYRPSYRVQR